jgi:hypothetical protein
LKPINRKSRKKTNLTGVNNNRVVPSSNEDLRAQKLETKRKGNALLWLSEDVTRKLLQEPNLPNIVKSLLVTIEDSKLPGNSLLFFKLLDTIYGKMDDVPSDLDLTEDERNIIFLWRQKSIQARGRQSYEQDSIEVNTKDIASEEDA